MGLGTLVIGAAYFLSRPNARTEIDVAPKFTSSAGPKDPQTERDLLLLLDFAVYQTTSELLDSLIKAAPLRILSEQLVLAAERYEESENIFSKCVTNWPAHIACLKLRTCCTMVNGKLSSKSERHLQEIGQLALILWTFESGRLLTGNAGLCTNTSFRN